MQKTNTGEHIVRLCCLQQGDHTGSPLPITQLPSPRSPTSPLNLPILYRRVARAPRIAALEHAETGLTGEMQIIVRARLDVPLGVEEIVHHAVNRYGIGREEQTIRRLVPERHHRQRRRTPRVARERPIANRQHRLVANVRIVIQINQRVVVTPVVFAHADLFQAAHERVDYLDRRVDVAIGPPFVWMV